MDEREKIFEEINSCTNPSSIKDEYLSNSNHVARFKNIFAFLDVCKSRRVTTENSITYYDETEGYMYIKFPFIVCC